MPLLRIKNLNSESPRSRKNPILKQILLLNITGRHEVNFLPLKKNFFEDFEQTGNPFLIATKGIVLTE